MKLTIAEIAARSGVSTGTVSRVINGKSTVAEPTRKKVLEVMKRLGYEPDPVARELSMRSKHTIGIWVGAGENRLSPYFSVIWRALLREMQSRGTMVIELPTDLGHVRRRIDAVVMFHCADLESRLAALAERKVPAVLIGHHPGISCVMPDDPGGGRLAGETLLAQGHRRLLHLTAGEDLQWARERAEGFMEALSASRKRGIEVEVVRGQGSVLGGYRMMRGAWKRGLRPTALFCATDEIAVGALGALEDLGVKVPEQVSVLGFDGLTELYPGLASVAQDIPGIAHVAVSLAQAALDRRPPQHKVVPVSFVPGATLAPAP